MVSLKEHLETYSSKSTRRMYHNGIASFLRFIYSDDDSDPDVLSTRYMADKRNHAQDLLRFVVSIDKMPPTTRRAYKTAIIQWFGANDIFINDFQKGNIARKIKGSVVTQDGTLTTDDLAKILYHTPQPILKTLILVLTSSGMRIGEALSLKWSDIEMDRDPVRVHIRAISTKTKEPRITYISTEAKKALIEWKGMYNDFVEQREKYQNLNRPSPADDRIFPIDAATVQRRFQAAVTKAGLERRDPSTGRNAIHIHSTRKYFRSVLPKGGNGNALDYVEILLGHTGYLTGAYRRIAPEEVEEFYRQAEHVLWVSQPVQVSTEEIRNLQEENKALKKELEDIKARLDRRDSVSDQLMRLAEDDPEAFMKGLQNLIKKK
jgi:integrase